MENAKRQEELRKEDAKVIELHTLIDDVERRFVKQQVDEQIKASIKAGEGYFTTS